MSIESWITFAVVWTLAAIPIGPNALNCISTAVTEGFEKSLFCVAGILAAAVLFIVAVSSGFSALLLLNTEIFLIVKFIGAAYLVWMGIKIWMKDPEKFEAGTEKKKSKAEIFKAGFFVSLTNPKAMLAYGAVFSQFIDLNQPFGLQLIVLASTALWITGLVYSGYCWFGSVFAHLLNTRKKQILFNRISGSAFIAGGLALLGYEAEA